MEQTIRELTEEAKASRSSGVRALAEVLLQMCEALQIDVDFRPERKP